MAIPTECAMDNCPVLTEEMSMDQLLARGWCFGIGNKAFCPAHAGDYAGFRVHRSCPHLERGEPVKDCPACRS